jgi:hypothetical protein
VTRPDVSLEALTAERFLAAIAEGARLRGFDHTNRWDLAHVLAGYPERVATASAGELSGPGYFDQQVIVTRGRQLARAGLVRGCTDGCRGDFEILDPPREPEPEPEWSTDLPEDGAGVGDVIVIDTDGVEYRLEWSESADAGGPHGITGWAEALDGMHMLPDVVAKWRPLTRWEE